MTIRKQPNGKWLCECYPNGRDGKRVRKQFATKGEAVAFENFTMDEVGSDSNLLIVFYVQIMPDDLVMQLHRF